MDYAVGIDIGGTKIAIAVVNQLGELLSSVTFSMNLSKSPAQMTDKIIFNINGILKEADIKREALIGIGVGAPGPLNTEKGITSCPPNLTGWIDVPIKQWLENAFSVPVLLENDANAAALAEKWVGAGTDCENFTYLTISTGIGAGIISNGKLLSGSRGNAGEIGHTVIDPRYGICSCGQIGCLDLIASGRAIAKNGSLIIGEELSTKQVIDLYGNGNEALTTYINHVFWALGAASVSIVNILDTEKIVIGGGVSQIGAPLFESIESYIGKYALNPEGRKTKIVAAQLNEHAGVIGAAKLCFFAPLIKAKA